MKYLVIALTVIMLFAQAYSEGVMKEAKEATTLGQSNKHLFSSLDNPSIPKYFQVKQNYPNPFNATTIIEYELPQRATTSIIIYNSIGRKITTLENGIKEAGSYRLIWDGKNYSGHDVSSGIYFYVVIADNNYSIKKMVLLK